MRKYLNIKKSSLGQVVLLFLLLIPGLYLRFNAANNHIDILTLKFLPDDAFYYFKIAQNISDGFGSTFDKTTLTNGYHPLWLMLITPFWYFFSGLHAPVIYSLMLGACFSAVASVFIFLIFKELKVSLLSSYAGAIIYFYNYMTIHYSLNGLETSLSTCTLALGFWLFLRGKFYDSGRESILLGLAFGLAVLSRTDLALLFSPIALFCAVNYYRKRKIQNLSIFIMCGLLIVLPWLIWCKFQFGSYVQVSGKALSYYEHQNFFAEHPNVHLLHPDFISELYQRFINNFQTWAYHSGFIPLSWDIYPNGHWILPTFIAFYLIIIPVLNSKLFIKIWPIYLFVPSYFCIHILVRWSAREWYTAVPMFLFTILFIVLIDSISNRFQKKIAQVSICSICIILLLLNTYSYYKVHEKGFYWSQKISIKNVQDYKKAVPRDEIMGASDCGYIGYMMQDHQIINLDGLVNNKAYEASRNGRLSDYMLETKIDRVIIRGYLMKDYFMGPDWELKWINSYGCLYPYSASRFHNKIIFKSIPDDSYLSKKVFSKNWTPGNNNAWNDGPDAEITIPYSNLWGSIQLEITCYAFVSVGYHDQSFELSFKDQLIATKKVSPEISIIKIPLEEGILNEGDNKLKLKFAYCVAPADLSAQFQDSRKLSINISRIEIRKTD